MNIYEKIIELGIIFLLIYTPLAFGGVTPHSIALLEIVSALLLIVWLVKIFRQRKTIRPLPPDVIDLTYHIPFTRTPFTVAIGLFFVFIFLQVLPLPGSLVNIVSPATYRLYTEGAGHTGLTIPKLLPLSVCSQATEMEFYKFLAYVVIFCLVIDTFRTRRQVKRLVSVIIVIGFIEALYGFIQFIAEPHYVFSHKTESWVNGTFVNKNHFAGYLEMVIPLAFGVLFTRFESPDASKLRISTDNIREKYPKVFLLLLGVFFMICTLVLSGSRGGIISFSLGTIVFAFLAHIRRLLQKWVVLLLIFFAMAIGLTVLMGQNVLIQRLNTLLRIESDTSFQFRWELWKTAGNIFQDFPTVGSGFGTFSHLNQRYRTFRGHRRHSRYVENDYLQMLSESGIIGTSLILVMGGAFFYRIFTAWKRRHSRWAVAIVTGGLSAMVSLLIHSTTDFNFHIPSNALLFSVIAALSYVTAYIHKDGTYEKRSQLSLSQRAYYSMGVLVGVCVLLYLFYVSQSYYAWDRYQKASTGTQPRPTSNKDERDHGSEYLKKAIRHDRNNAEYYYALGSSIFQRLIDPHGETMEFQDQEFPEAEGWLQHAVLLDPANPWYYYELGRLSHSRGDCLASQKDDCPAARYFSAALTNAPNELFLRKAVGRWFFDYDQDAAQRLLREAMAKDISNLPKHPTHSDEFSKFLYDIHMDYESDREIQQALQSENSGLEPCQVRFIDQSSPDSQEIELGHDDGSAEWKTHLVKESDRVKKEICLPENIEEYRYAALKIYMNSGGNENFVTKIWLDDQLIKEYYRAISATPQWYEIPLDMTLLQGKSRINVYIRVSGTSESGNYLQIWGDQGTSSTQSVFNLETADDFSLDEGTQSGEFMIRLVLGK